ncbi:MAG TPA: hypothetical protein VE338_21075 [Ktedonobacterales bacterium]|jgi:uncharacterized protein YcbX|nr:hypothetical protein [Ktedonobacterales bacterium]
MIPTTVCELWRYLVKSLLGERGEHFSLDQRGMIGDRLYAVRDEAGKFGSGKPTRHFRRIDGLFRCRAVYNGGVPLITFSDASTLRGDDPAIHEALTAHLGLSATLSREADISHLDAGQVHILTTASLRPLRTLGASWLAGSGDRAEAALDECRFPPNVLVETGAEGFPECAGKAATSP